MHLGWALPVQQVQVTTSLKSENRNDFFFYLLGTTQLLWQVYGEVLVLSSWPATDRGRGGQGYLEPGRGELRVRQPSVNSVRNLSLFKYLISVHLYVLHIEQLGWRRPPWRRGSVLFGRPRAPSGPPRLSTRSPTFGWWLLPEAGEVQDTWPWRERRERRKRQATPEATILCPAILAYFLAVSFL